MNFVWSSIKIYMSSESEETDATQLGSGLLLLIIWVILNKFKFEFNIDE